MEDYNVYTAYDGATLKYTARAAAPNVGHKDWDAAARAVQCEYWRY